MRKFFKFLLLLLTAGLFTATGWAELVAEWNKFTAEDLTQSGYTLDLNGNTVENGVVTIDKDIGLKVTSSEIGIWTIVLDVEDAPTTSMILDAKVKNDNYIGLYSDNGNLKSTWTNNLAYGATKNSWNPSNRHMVAMTYSYDLGQDYQGTTVYLDGVKCENHSSLRTNSSLVSFTIGYTEQTGNNIPNTKGIATGMKIHRARLYNSKLTDGEIRDDYIRSFTHYERAISGTEDWASEDWGGEEVTNPAADTTVTLNVDAASILTMNETSNSLKGLEIKGSQLLTIASGNSNKLSADTTFIDTDTTVEAGAASLGAVTIASGKTLTVNDANVITSTIGGTVGLNFSLGADADLTKYGSSGSTIHLKEGGSTGYLAKAKTVAADFILDGTIDHNNGWSTSGGQVFSGTFSGSGILQTSGDQSDVIQIIGDATQFKGAITVTGKHCVSFGAQTDDDTKQGKIVIVAGKTANVAAGKEWTADKGIEVSGTIGGSGTIASTLTLNEGATLDATAGILTANTLATLPTALTVKVANALEVGGTLDILTTTATPNTASTTVTVMVGGSMAEGAYSLSLKATDASLQLVRNEERSTVKVNVSEDSSALSSALNGAVLAKNATLTIHFTANDQTFTFDNALAVTMASLTVTAEDGVTGCTIALPATEGLVIATATAINADVIVTGKGELGTVTVAENMQLTVPSATTFTGMTTAASSILEMAGNADFTQAGAVDIFSTFIGTYKVGRGTTTKLPSASSSGDANTKGNYIVGEDATLDLNGRLADETSTITLCNGATLTSSATVGNGYNWKSWPYIHLYDANTTATISGKTFSTVNSGNGAHTYYLRGGTLEFALASNETFKASSLTFLKESGSTEPAGTIKVTSGTLEFGKDDASAANVAVVLNGGKIKVDTNYAFGALGGTGGQLEVAANKQLTIGALAQTSLYAGVISGTGAINVTGGELTLSGVNTNTGALNINGAKVSMTGSWAGAVTVSGTITGAGSIGGALTLNEGATIDATAGTLTVNGEVNLPSALTVKGVSLSDDAPMEQVLKKTYQLAEGVEEEATSTEVTIDTSSDYYLVKKADGFYVKAKTVKTTLEATMSADKNKLSLSDFFDAKTEVLSADTILTIDFGSEDGEAGTFTFDTDNTGAVSIAQIIVKGTNGGTITKAEGAGAVSATATTIAEGCAVTVPESTAEFGAVAIEAGATLKVADVTTATSVTGAGTLVTTVYPANTTGLNAEEWTGKVVLDGVKLTAASTEETEPLRVLGHANSTLCLKNVTGTLWTKTQHTATTYACPVKLEIEGINTIDAATRWALPLMTGSVSGSGSLLFTAAFEASNENTNYLFSGSFENFTGNFDVQSEDVKVVIGPASWTNWSAWETVTNDSMGKISFATPVNVNGIFKAMNGITVTAKGAISGAGTIDCSLTLADGATIAAPTVKEKMLTVTGTATANGTATMTGNFKVAKLGGSGTLAVANNATGSLTVTGTSTFGGSLNGVGLVVANGANLTLTGNSTVSTIAGEGSLTVEGATLTLTSPSTFDGTLSIGQYATLTCEASLTIQETLQFVATQAYLKTTKGAQVTIAKDATIIPNSTGLPAMMELVAGATIDLDGASTEVTKGDLKVDEIRLPVGDEGVVYVKATKRNPSVVISTGEMGTLPKGLSAANFALTSSDTTLHFFVDTTQNKVALVKVKADLTQKTNEERQAILALGYQWGVPLGEIENPGVEYVFDGKYGEAYTYTWGKSVEGEGEELFCNLYCFVNFGISGITNVNTQCIDGVDYVVADVIATVEPMVEGASVSFKNGAEVVLYLEVEGRAEPLKTVTIKKDDTDVREVTFTDVRLSAENGTHKLKVRASKDTPAQQ